MRFSLLAVFLVASAALAAADTSAAPFASLKFREIGPATMGGRVDDFAVVESNPNIAYVATASGGVFKTTNGGNTWIPIFDDQPVSTIGDVTVAPSEPDTVWVGSGEANNRQSSSWGNGVYKSTDGGKTWTHLGLKDTHHIARILIHPTNPDIVYVAAQGKLWGPNEERGVFKTTDGGKTWTKALYINPDTGVTDIAMDLANPGTIYAAAYQRRRTAFGFNGGGPGSALYRTTDGGATWKKLTNGLPTAEKGRMALDVYRRNSNIVYALVEAAQGGTGIYRSDDKGDTWTKMSNTNPRPMYFSQVRIDPNNDQRVWVLGVQVHYSDDGGKTFRTNLVNRIHVDFHALWINPADSNHMLIGCDGGIHTSRDRGVTWDGKYNIAISQFYEIGLDMQKPYKVCGGLQDNNSWCGPSATTNQRGIRNDDWYTVQGGDGFYAQIDPEEPHLVYAESQDGNLVRRDLRTHESRAIRPREESDTQSRYRFQWNSPVVISKHDRKTLYYGGNHVFKSTDQGDTWRRISPDLTTNVDRKTLDIMGRKMDDRTVLSRNDGVANFPTITTLAESTVRAGILWTGSDDGLVHVSQDGETFSNVTANIPNLPKGTYVSRLTPSAHAAGTAYAAFDGHRTSDFGIYLYKTTDFGKTWKLITKGIPQAGGVLNVVREHPRNPNLLFAGGEHGLYFSLDAGESWAELKNNLPRVPVDDIAIHPRDNDLVLGTHGRGIWILDSISALEQAAAAPQDAALHVFDVRPAIMWRMARTRDYDGHDHYLGANPPYGALIDFHAKSKPEPRDLRVRILDAAGKLVRQYTPRDFRNLKFEAGVNRLVWDLRADSPIAPLNLPTATGAAPAAEAQTEGGGGAGGGGGGGGGGFGGGFSRGPMVDPGLYTIEISLGAAKATKTIPVEEDPRVTFFSNADRAARRAMISDVTTHLKQADALRRKFTAIDTALKAHQDAAKRPEVAPAAAALTKSLDAIRSHFAAGGFGGGGGFGAAPSAEELRRPEPAIVLPSLTARFSQLLNGLDSFSAAPSPTQTAQFELAKKALAEASSQLDRIAKEQVPAFNEALSKARPPAISLPQ